MSEQSASGWGGRVGWQGMAAFDHNHEFWTLIWTLIDPVSCVSSWYWVNAGETDETVHKESGMRYQLSYHNILGS